MKSLTQLIEIHLEKILKSVIALELFLLTLASVKRPFFPDEIECLKSAWFVSLGDIPYKDFFQHHHPFFYYVLAPLFNLFSRPITACIPARIVSLLFFLGTIYGVYKIASTHYNHLVGLLSVAIVPSWVACLRAGFEIRPDTPQLFFGVWSYYVLSQAIANNNHLLFFISGLCWAFSYLFLQKSSLLLLVLLTIIVTEIIYKKASFFELFLFLIGATVPLFGYFIYLIYQEDFTTYWAACHTFNQQVFKRNIQDLISIKGIIRSFITMSFFQGFFVDDRLQWTFFFIGLTTSIFARKNLYLFFLTIIGIAWACVCPTGHQYHVGYAPFASILVALGLYEVFKNRWQQGLIALFFILWLILSHLFVLIDSNTKQFDEARILSRDFTSKDHVIAENRSLLFYPRTHPAWVFIDFIQGKTFIVGEKYLYNTWIEAIKNKKPRLIHTMHTQGALTQEAFFKENYEPHPLYPSFFRLKIPLQFS